MIVARAEMTLELGRAAYRAQGSNLGLTRTEQACAEKRPANRSPQVDSVRDTFSPAIVRTRRFWTFARCAQRLEHREQGPTTGDSSTPASDGLDSSNYGRLVRLSHTACQLGSPPTSA